MKPFPLARSLSVALATLLAGALVGCGAMPAPTTAPTPPPRPKPTFWVTSPTESSRSLQVEATAAAAAPGGTADVRVDPTQVHQVWWGTGAAMTDSSVELLEDRPGLLKALYDPAAAKGAHLNMLRLPLSATDFSRTPWTWSWDSVSATPTPEARRAIALVKSGVLPLRPSLRVVGAAWSAPASLKSGSSVRGGALVPGDETSYADLLVAQARWLSRHGLPLWATSLGNEPGHSSDYPSMTMTDAQMSALGTAVGPRLDALGTRLWAVDHNWYDRDRVDAVLAGSAGFDGAAFHCYAGQPGQMAGLGVPRMVTECTGTTDGAVGTFGWDAKNLVADSINAGSSGLMMWNLALDPSHGPVDPATRGGCGQCRGVLTVTPTGAIREPEFYTLAHLSRAASPGAHVVSVTGPPWLSVAAFRNPDGTFGVFGQSRSSVTQTVRLAVGSRAGRTYEVRPGEMFSYRAPLPTGGA
ncbi:hypothetical protein ABLE68_03600 [Nocardioides sp. CN2-186]|uniref:glycoside hydrolase family 30 protein n=1 Tax=Nocardioides tweenelious TaxID=3156607 RepID=UPI0032B53BA3